MITLLSPAKVNLALDILQRDASGYHLIDTVFYEVKNLNDRITITKTDSDCVVVTCNDPRVPLDETNTVYKAAKLLGIEGVAVEIDKKIPVGAGLGGGSSNAATALRGFNQLFGLKKSRAELIALGSKIGMDVPFFLHRYCARGTHFGEDIEGLPVPKLEIAIVDTGIAINSRDAYAEIVLAQCGRNRDKTEKLIHALKQNDAEGIAANAHNDFEFSVFEKYPALLKKKRKLENAGARKVLLAGSGGALCVLSPSF